MSTGTRHFIRHYIEMVIAMFVGMAVLGAPAGLVVNYDDTAQMIAAMAVTMTLPMAGWMRFRGHAWQPIAEMSAAMLLPATGVLALLATNVMTDMGALMLVEHIAMLAGMLVAMLLRPSEYAGHHGHHHAQQEAA